MAASQSITQRIALVGAEEIKAQLAEMGKSGEAAIAAIDRAVKEANSSTTRFGAGVAAVRGHVVEMARSLAPVGEAIGKVRDSFREFGEKLTEMGERLFPHFREALALVTAGAAAALLEFAKSAAANVRETDNMAKALGFTTEDFEGLKLAASQAGLEQEQMTVGLSRFAQAAGKAHEEQIKLNGEVSSGAQVLKGHSQRLAEAIGGLRGPTEGLADAHTKTTAIIDSDVTVLRGGVNAVTDFSTPFKALHMDIKNLNGTFKSQIELLKEAARKLTGLKDAALQAMIGQELFGRSWRNQIALLNNLGSALTLAKAKIEEYGIGITDTERNQAREFNRSLSVMQTVGERVKDMLFNTIGQALVPLMDALTETVGRNAGAWVSWARQLVADVTPAIRDLLMYLTGQEANPQTTFVRNLVTVFRELQSTASVVFTVLRAGFQTLTFVLDPIAGLINKIFGTELTGQTLAATAIVLQLTGVFGLLGAALTAVWAVAGLLFATLTAPVALAIIAVAGLIAVWYHFRDEIADIFTHLPEYAEQAWEAIKGGWTMAVTYLIEQWHGFVAYIEASLNNAAKMVSDFFGGSGGDGAVTAPIPPAQHAGGGRVRGPGGVDRVPAWLTAGEFVMRTAAVGKYGLGFMHMLNQGMLPAMHFALGGFVAPRPAVAFAGSRLPSLARGNTLNLTIGGETFRLHADDSATLNSLGRAATNARIKSTGRKPGWHGG